MPLSLWATRPMEPSRSAEDPTKRAAVVPDRMFTATDPWTAALEATAPPAPMLKIFMADLDLNKAFFALTLLSPETSRTLLASRRFTDTAAPAAALPKLADRIAAMEFTSEASSSVMDTSPPSAETFVPESVSWLPRFIRFTATEPWKANFVTPVLMPAASVSISLLSVPVTVRVPPPARVTELSVMESLRLSLWPTWA